MDSKKFGLQIQVTYHARKRMAERKISEDLLKEIIETGGIAIKMRQDYGSLSTLKDVMTT